MKKKLYIVKLEVIATSVSQAARLKSSGTVFSVEETTTPVKPVGDPSIGFIIKEPRK